MKALLVIKEQVLLSQVPPISEEKKRDDAISFPSFCSEGEESFFFFFVKQNNKSR